MGGTVQKNPERAKQFLLTQHEQNFRERTCVRASAITTQSSIGEKFFRRGKIFLRWFFEAVESVNRGAR